jgi:hypothetical protein
VITTDGTGRARILFTDDGAVTLGANTVFNLAEYRMGASGEKPAFAGRVAKGMMRVITGKITEQNPEGFKVTTPDAVIGIRGTIISVMVDDQGESVVYVENTPHQVFVNGTLVPSGSLIDLRGTEEHPRPQPITPTDRDELNEELAAGSPSGSGPSAPEASETASVGANDNGEIDLGTALNDNEKSELVDSTPEKATTAWVSGNLSLIDGSWGG